MRIRAEIKTRTEVRRWGHSLGVILPKEIIRRHGIRERQMIELSIKKQDDIKRLFGRFKFDLPTQKIKDELKKGWKE